MSKDVSYNTTGPWVALFSRTGKEIIDIHNRIDKVPSAIISTKPFNEWCDELQQLCVALDIPHMTLNKRIAKDVDTLHQVIKSYGGDNPLITTHGWLYILPAGICDTYRVYNGHPGLILDEYYPELKGIDPQIRAYHGKYDTIGSVIHRVIPQVDEGEIITYSKAPNTSVTVDDMYELLRELSLETWVNFFNHTTPEDI